MKQRTIDGVTYYPRTYKEGGMFYACILFVSSKITDTYYLTPPQDTRSKARTIAVNHIKNIQPTPTMLDVLLEQDKLVNDILNDF